MEQYNSGRTSAIQGDNPQRGQRWQSLARLADFIVKTSNPSGEQGKGGKKGREGPFEVPPDIVQSVGLQSEASSTTDDATGTVTTANNPVMWRWVRDKKGSPPRAVMFSVDEQGFEQPVVLPNGKRVAPTYDVILQLSKMNDAFSPPSPLEADRHERMKHTESNRMRGIDPQGVQGIDPQGVQGIDPQGQVQGGQVPPGVRGSGLTLH